MHAVALVALASWISHAATNPVLAPTALAELLSSPTPASGTYDFVVIGDTHAPQSATIANYAYSGVQALNGETTARFLLLDGDWSYTGGNTAEWQTLVSPQQSLITVAPMFAVSGNHENSIVWSTSTDYGTLACARQYGVLPTLVDPSYVPSYSLNPQTGRMDYFFDYASTRYVMLDSAHGDEYTGASNN